MATWAVTFPDEQRGVQWWSLRVPVGKSAAEFERIRAEWAGHGRRFGLTCNEEYTRRLTRLVESARTNSSMTNEPSHSFLQMLTRLRGERPIL